MPRFLTRRQLLQPPGLVLVATLMLGISAIPAIASVGIPDATTAARIAQKQKQTRQILPENYDLTQYPVIDANVKHWRSLLWTTGIVSPKTTFVADAIDGILALANRSNLSNGQQRVVEMAMQVGTQLYLTGDPVFHNLRSRFATIMTESADPAWVAMSLSALQQGGATAADLTPWLDYIQKRFPGWGDDPILYTTIRDVELSFQPLATPPLQDLLTWEIAPHQPHLFVLCQPNRRVLCQAILRDAQGQFLRDSGDKTGPLWSVPLLLESIHTLDWNFSRGRTPQGIYRIEGEVPQPDLEYFRAYGQFALVNLFAPREPGVKRFLPNKAGTIPNLPIYQSLLPPSWRNYFPIQQSYWAGKLGRGLFRIHGSGEATNFFNGKILPPESYDWNPTLGCLSALEIYDEDGRLVQSDMPKILNALQQVGGKNYSGYLVVVDVPNNDLATIPTEITISQTPIR